MDRSRSGQIANRFASVGQRNVENRAIGNIDGTARIERASRCQRQRASGNRGSSRVSIRAGQDHREPPLQDRRQARVTGQAKGRLGLGHDRL